MNDPHWMACRWISLSNECVRIFGYLVKPQLQSSSSGKKDYLQSRNPCVLMWAYVSVCVCVCVDRIETHNIMRLKCEKRPTAAIIIVMTSLFRVVYFISKEKKIALTINFYSRRRHSRMMVECEIFILIFLKLILVSRH
jgi:hypothetical protein